MIQESVCLVKDDCGIATLVCNYPVMGDYKTLYRPELSNSQLALKKSQTLFSRLRNRNLVAPFHHEILKSIEEGHMKILSFQEQTSILKEYHAFAGLNYALKDSSLTQKCRPVTDSSLYHHSGSLNSRLPVGPNCMNDMRVVLECFRLSFYAVLADLHRCYRSMGSDDVGNRLRLMS
jgi:hypothetical protein